MGLKQLKSSEKEAPMETGESSMEIESKYIIAANRRETSHKSCRGLPVFRAQTSLPSYVVSELHTSILERNLRVIE